MVSTLYVQGGMSTYFLEYGRHVARLRRRRRRRRAYAPTNNTASHDNHEKILHGFPFLSHDDHGAPLSGPSGFRSSAINGNLENVSILLDELDFHFNVIGITETKITISKENNFHPSIPSYVFEYVPTPLASGGVGLFVDQSLHYTVLEKTSNEAFQAI